LSINWEHLIIILRDITNRPFVHITLTTHDFSEGDDAIASVIFDEIRVDFFLNAIECGDLYGVIKALAHEAAHVVLNNIEHNGSFFRKWSEVERIMYEMYSEYEFELILQRKSSLNTRFFGYGIQ